MGNLSLPGNPRYQPKDLQSVFGYDNLFRAVAEVEIAALKTLADIGIIPAITYAEIPGLVILPNIAIAAKDHVRSILLVSKKKMEEVEHYREEFVVGCVGNGMLGPARNGSGDTSIATLLVENCTGAYAYLNGNYDGLAVATPSSKWDYDSLLRIWLSKPSGETPVAALTMLSEPL